jgi:diguanylate cyclase (GGDEF)-like protein
VLGAVLIAGLVFMTLTEVIFGILAGGVTGSTAVTAASDVALLIAWLLRRRNLHAAAMVTIATVACVIPISMMQTGGLRAPVLIVMPLLPMLAASFAGTRGASWLGALLVLGTLCVGCATRLGLMSPSLLSETARDSMGIAFALSSVGLAVFVIRTTEGERRRLEAQLHAQSSALYETSVHDPLTHLYNRRYLSHRLDEELAFALRHDAGLGVVILDLDFFKRINDEHGHGGGDEVLVALGAVLHNAVRKEDVVARYGGEEFAIVLRGLDLASVAVAAERVRAAVEAHTFLVGGRRVPVTVSAGCASLACCGPTKAVGHLLSVADARLYRAKRSGRNRVAFTD